jgi:hypothetical protein
MGTEARGRVTKIVDRLQAAVRAAAAGYRAYPGESTPSCGATPAAVPEGLSQGPVTARRRPVAWFSSKHRVRFGTVAPAPPYGRNSPDSHLSGSCHRWDGLALDGGVGVTLGDELRGQVT